MERGSLLGLRDWLRENVHRHGFSAFAEDRVKAATGNGLGIAPFVRYLWNKYGELYQLSR